MSDEGIKISDYITGPVIYDKFGGQYFWITDPKDPEGGMKMLAEMRGWGSIQNMKQFVDNQKAAGEYQDKLGNWIAEAINDKLFGEKAMDEDPAFHGLLDSMRKYWTEGTVIPLNPPLDLPIESPGSPVIERKFHIREHHEKWVTVKVEEGDYILKAKDVETVRTALEGYATIIKMQMTQMVSAKELVEGQLVCLELDRIIAEMTI